MQDLGEGAGDLLVGESREAPQQCGARVLVVASLEAVHIGPWSLCQENGCWVLLRMKTLHSRSTVLAP